MGWRGDSILTFFQNRLLKKIRGQALTGRDFMTSKLWEISHLFNLKLFHSSFNTEKPLHGGVFSFELFIVYIYFYILWTLSLQNYRIFLIFTFSKTMNEKGSISLHSKCFVSTAFYLTCFQIPSCQTISGESSAYYMQNLAYSDVSGSAGNSQGLLGRLQMNTKSRNVSTKSSSLSLPYADTANRLCIENHMA